MQTTLKQWHTNFGHFFHIDIFWNYFSFKTPMHSKITIHCIVTENADHYVLRFCTYNQVTQHITYHYIHTLKTYVHTALLFRIMRFLASNFCAFASFSNAFPIPVSKLPNITVLLAKHCPLLTVTECA